MIVVCGIDGSPNAQHALMWSADLVAGTGGEVIAVHAVGLVEELQGETVPTASHRQEIEDLCVTVWCAQLARSGVGWRHAVLDGHPVAPIVGKKAMDYGWQELHDSYAEKLSA